MTDTRVRYSYNRIFLDETSFLSLVTEPMNELESTDINENENKKQMEDIYVVTVEK